MSTETGIKEPAISNGMPGLLVRYSGIVPYEAALAVQENLVRQRAANEIPDVFWLLQHPPVFTLGKFRGETELIASNEQLQREGIQIIRTNRGGSITFHGPGQLVGYLVLDLKKLNLMAREYVFKLEEVIIRGLGKLEINAARREGYPGVWVGERKICSIGIHIGRHITMHGFALNVDNDLHEFGYINPCGLKGVQMTSIKNELNSALTCEEIAPMMAGTFLEVFSMRQINADNLVSRLGNTLTKSSSFLWGKS